jgi:hypothetical protein
MGADGGKNLLKLFLPLSPFSCVLLVCNPWVLWLRLNDALSVEVSWIWCGALSKMLP